MAKTEVLVIASPGSRALKNAKYERYCRLRASAQPRIPAYREAGWETSDDDNAYSNACRLERRPGIRERIEYLTKQAEERIAEKRQRIEERLWAIHEANIQDFFTTEDDINPTEISSNPAEIANNPDQQKVAVSPRARVVPRPLTELDPETAKLIEDVREDRRGRLVPRLYSKVQASRELRAMLNISAKEAPRDVTQLSDQELIATLAQQARELGVTINLDYRFARQPPATETDGQDSRVIDVESENDTPRKS
jgi:hypothetical protein